jgi:hypothetical protein
VVELRKQTAPLGSCTHAVLDHSYHSYLISILPLRCNQGNANLPGLRQSTGVYTIESDNDKAARKEALAMASRSELPEDVEYVGDGSRVLGTDGPALNGRPSLPRCTSEGMKHPCTAIEAQQLYPQDYAAIVEQFVTRKTKLANASRDPAILGWHIERAVEGRGFSFAEIMSGEAVALRRAQEAMTVDQKVADEVGRSSCRLVGHGQRWSRAAPVSMPYWLEQEIRGRIEHEEATRLTHEALPEEEKNRQLQDLIRNLHKDPRFVAVRLPR